MNPHRETYGFTEAFEFNWYLALLAMLSWLFSREQKFIPSGPLPVLIYLFAFWICITTYFAIDPDFSFGSWDRTIKSLLMVVFVMLMTTNIVRAHALVWVCALSLGYFAVKGAGFVAISGGGLVFGPADSLIEDNNHLSVALAALLPLLLYLIRTSAARWLQLGCIVVCISIVITIVGTYSRGGFLTLGAMGAILALRSRAKLQIAAAGLISLIIIFQTVPQAWLDRMSTITATEVDGSVQGRYLAWQTAWNAALERPLGGGFNFAEQKKVWDQYSGLPGYETFHAAHNMYFQVLGEHGFIGLGIFLMILIAALRNTQIAMRLARKQPETWVHLELANALQLSILGIMIGTVSLSLAYYDMFFTFYALTYSLRRMLEQPLEHVPANGLGQPAVVASARWRRNR
jgi:probable O-glycosylation ligase (exosortase A-associated)